MCGIAAISLSPKDTKMDVAVVAEALLEGIRMRGPDATGAAWYDAQSQTVKLTKVAVPAEVFIRHRHDSLPHSTPTMILHTRMATHGDTSNRLNNHPIRYDNIVGVHNGVLQRHGKLFEAIGLKPNAEVDSEALMALVSGGADPVKRFKLMEGDAAMAWIDLNEPDVLHVARVVDRPVHMVQTNEGSFIMASTRMAVDAALKAGGLVAEFRKDLEEAMYMKVVGGVISEYVQIPGVRKDRSWSQKYAYTSGPTHTPTVHKVGVKTEPKAIEAKGSEDDLLFSDADAVEKWDSYRDEWYGGQTTENLIRLYSVSKSETCARALAARGYDTDGKELQGDVDVKYMTLEELLVQANMGIGDEKTAAIAELALRGRNQDGELLEAEACEVVLGSD